MGLLETTVWDGAVFTAEGWAPGSGGRLDVVEPATGEVLGSVGRASAEDVHQAAAAAAQAQREWAALAHPDRARVLRRAAALWEEHAGEVAEWVVRESGSIRPKAAGEVQGAVDECYHDAALPSNPAGEVLPSVEDRWSLTRRRPVGVVAVIAPFNFPLYLAVRAVAPALALGNAVLLKPDPRTPVCGGVVLARIFEEAGLPSGLLQVLPGGSDVGQAMVVADAVRVVSFTGSTETGRAIATLAGQHLKRTHLELGGNSALVVLPGADLDLAASAGAFGSFSHQGQVCLATGRHLVHASLVEAYVQALAAKADALPVGNPAAADVALGPVIDQGQVDRIDAFVSQAVASGARLSAGGAHEDLFYRPTVLAEVDTATPTWSQEVFGPVAPVLPFTTLEEAITLASASPYGLSLGILGDVGMAMQVADAVPCGMVHINEQTVIDEVNVPFGGVGVSGNGSRVGGAQANTEAFTETQWLTVRPTIAPYPF